MLCILALYSVSAHKNVGIRKFSVLVASISAKSQFLMIFDSVLSFLYINVRDFWSAWLPSCSALKTAPICKISEKSASIRGIFSKICNFSCCTLPHFGERLYSRMSPLFFGLVMCGRILKFFFDLYCSFKISVILALTEKLVVETSDTRP